MGRINYGPAFGPKHGNQLMGRPTRVLKILWAYSWAGPLMSAKYRGPLAGPALMIRKNLVGLYLGRPIMAHKNLMGLYLGRPIMARKILGAFSWASHYGPQNLVGL